MVKDFHLSREGKRTHNGRVEALGRGPLNRHQAEFASLCRVARGAMAKKFAWIEGKDRIEAASQSECEKRGEAFQPIDFAHSARDAIHRALAQRLERVEAQEFRPPNPNFNRHRSSVDPWEWIETTDEIGNLVEWIIADAANAADSGGKEKTKSESEPIFREFGPTQWAKPVEPTSFFIKQVLCTDTWGVNGGPEKSLKTHDNFAIAMSIATGINLYQSELFPVLRKGKVLTIVGEGGEKQDSPSLAPNVPRVRNQSFGRTERSGFSVVGRIRCRAVEQ